MESFSYTAFDVETPNRNNNSMCSIGLVHVENGAVTFQREYLVNPEADFDYGNVLIHGITEEMTHDAPTFPQVWKEIACFFDGLLIAHNATFDLSVLKASLDRHDLFIPEMYYVCTVLLARRHIPRERYGSHRLNDLSRGLGIALDHHNALSDADACRQIFEHLAKNYGLEERDVRVYR
ncbi:MAG: 3'-5' exonuclease [Eubacteriales bacterium]|nr:3'-5' exonuclease [Eubacteriales bacterium]